jgi:hypothetical protein
VRHSNRAFPSEKAAVQPALRAVGGFVHRIVTIPPGEIYLLGDFFEVGRGGAALPRLQIARLRADGTPDPTFDPH